MFDYIWTVFLYQPLFNFLIWIYNNWTNTNFGWAIVYLTLILRVLLLPLSILTERNKVKNEELVQEVARLEKTYAKDAIMKKEEIRRVLRKRQVKPWAKVIVLGIQALVLILLYQVFLRGITGANILKILYPSVDFPGAINTNFFGFDLRAHHDWIWAGACALFLLVEIYLELRKYKANLRQADLLYFIAFPSAVFIILWWLPMVKSLFVLTSMIFSAMVYQFTRLMFRKKKAAVPPAGPAAAAAPKSGH